MRAQPPQNVFVGNILDQLMLAVETSSARGARREKTPPYPWLSGGL